MAVKIQSLAVKIQSLVARIQGQQPRWRVWDPLMGERIVAKDKKAKPVGYASRWLVRVLMAGVLVVLVKEVVGWRFGSPEVVALFMWMLLLMLMGQRRLKLRSTWRITGMLVFTGIAALVVQFLLLPYNALQRQRAAVQRITDQGGGKVNMKWFSHYVAIANVDGWAQTQDGWVAPTFLVRWWEKHFGLGKIDELRIPASLMTKSFLQDLQPRSAHHLIVLLDGSNQIDPNYLEFFPQLSKSDRRYHHFKSIKDVDPFQSDSVERLTDMDVQLLRSVKGDPIWIDIDRPERLDCLRQLDRSFSLSLTLGGPVPQSLVRLVKESSHLQRVVFRQGFAGYWQPLFDAMNERVNPMELEFSGEFNAFTEAEWQSLAVARNIRSLKADLYLKGADLDALAMPDLERLEVSLIDRLPTLYRSPKLQSFAAREVRSLRLEDLRPMTSSSIREVVVEECVLSDGEKLQFESWLDHFQHVRINQQTLK